MDKDIHILITRFTNLTFKENKDYREKKKIICIYGSPVKISELILPDSLIIILEMNNSLNIIEGIGIIKNNYVKNERKHKIYSDNNYNRFIYKSNLRIDKKSFTDYEKAYIKKLEELLFYTKGHSKRGHGIQNLSLNVKKSNLNLNKLIEIFYLSRFVNIKKYKNIRILKSVY